MPDARVSILIEANDRANSVLELVRTNLSGMNGRGGIVGAASGVTRALGGIGFAVFGIQQLSNAIGGLATGFFGFNSSLEQASITYGTLLGSAEAAQQRIAELQKFAAVTPFDFNQVLEADRLLQTFGARSIENLTMVGDAAAGTSQNFNEVAFWIGRAYSAIEAGQPFGEASMRLQEMGILTATGRQELERLTEAGASSEEVWAVLTGEMGRFSGLMDDQSQSAKGLTSTMKDLMTMGFAGLTKPLFDRFKRGLGGLVGYMSSPMVVSGLTAGAEALEIALTRMEEHGRRVFGWFRDRGIPDLMALFDRMKPTLSVALPAAFDGFINALQNVAFWAEWLWDNGIKPLAEWIGELTSKAKIFASDPLVASIAGILGAIAGYAVAARIAMMGLSLVMGPLAPIASAVGTGFQLFGFGLSSLVGVGGLAATVLYTFVGALAYVGAALTAIPVGVLSAIVTALIGLVGLNPVSVTLAAIAAAILLWDKIPWSDIGNGIVSLAGAIKDKLKDALDSLPELPGIIGRALYDAIYGLVNLPAYIIESLSTLAQNLIVKLGERMASIPVSDIKDAIGGALSKVLEALAASPGLFGKAAAALGGAILDLITNFPGAAGKLASGIGDALAAIAKALPGALAVAARDFGNTLLNFITAPLGNFAQPARELIRGALSALVANLGSIATTAGALGAKVISAVADGFGAAAGFALRLGATIARFIIDVWSTAAGPIIATAGALGGKIAGWIGDGWSVVTGFATRLGGWVALRVAELAGGAGSLISAAARAIGSLIPGWFLVGLTTAAGWAGSLAAWIRAQIQAAWDAVKNWRPWDIFDGATPGAAGSASGGTFFGAPTIVLSVVIDGAVFDSEAAISSAVRRQLPALRRELDRFYA